MGFSEGWEVYGIDLPEAFVFPVTKLGVTEDVHGGGAFVHDSPTRVDCHVHNEMGSRRLEILSSLSPHTGAELEVAWAFEQQFPLALWLYRDLPCGIVPWAGRPRSMLIGRACRISMPEDAEHGGTDLVRGR